MFTFKFGYLVVWVDYINNMVKTFWVLSGDTFPFANFDIMDLVVVEL